MQPVRIGMNPTIVLIVLLLAVPLQLFFNHYLQQSYSSSSISEPESVVSGEMDSAATREVDGLGEARIEAMERLSSSALYLRDQFGATLRYYSSWRNIKEFFIIPRKHSERKPQGIHIGTFKTENGNTLQIFTSSSSSKKESSTKTTKSASSSSSKSGSSTKTTKSASSSSSKSLPKIEKEAPSSRAKEVEEYLMKEVYFAQSKEPRKTRPSNVHYEVGQVVKHKMNGYHGVIIGWDPVAKAPNWWLDKFYAKRTKEVIQTPHYHILIDSHFASGTPYHYIPAEDLEVVNNVQISAPEVSNFFEGYRDGKHIPRPWLRERYPLG